MIHLALPTGTNYGWGLCGAYLRKELSKITALSDPTSWAPTEWEKKVEGVCFHALEGVNLKQWMSLRGDKNLGYVFFENELHSSSISNASELDLVLAGSTWCQTQMNGKGILNTDVLIQGIDPELFYPLEPKSEEKEFVLFSGGKFEYRKGQDLVLAAFRILSQKYSNMRLITSWENQWIDSMRTMSLSKHVDYIEMGDTWAEKMHAFYVRNEVDPQKIQTCPLLPNRKMRSIYGKTDLGIFPNRCEGGTNLVLMEYMACGKPVVASFSSGHQDILTSENSFLVKSMDLLEIKDSQGNVSARWDDPSLEEIISQIELAYHQKERREQIGQNAAKSLKNLTWSAMAERVLAISLR